MTKVTKHNLEARHASLIEGTRSVELFDEQNLHGIGIYLMHNQSHEGQVRQSSLVLFIFSGRGELKIIQNHNESMCLPISKGDIITIEPNTPYNLTNTNQELFMASEISIKR